MEDSPPVTWQALESKLIKKNSRKEHRIFQAKLLHGYTYNIYVYIYIYIIIHVYLYIFFSYLHLYIFFYVACILVPTMPVNPSFVHFFGVCRSPYQSSFSMVLDPTRGNSKGEVFFNEKSGCLIGILTMDYNGL